MSYQEDAEILIREFNSLHDDAMRYRYLFRLHGKEISVLVCGRELELKSQLDQQIDLRGYPTCNTMN